MPPPSTTAPWVPFIDFELETPIYLQLARGYAHRISSGALAPGTRLPPTRPLADTLGVHRNTVIRAFAHLTERGWLTSHVGRGTFVAPAPGLPLTPSAPLPPDLPPSNVPRPLPWARLRARASEADPLLRLERLTASAPPHGDLIQLARMQPSPDLMPHEELRACLDHALHTLGPAALAYAPTQGVERLRVRIAHDLTARGIAVSADDLLITSGSQQALDLVTRLLVDPGDIVITEGRTYSGALTALSLAHAEVLTVPGDAFGPDIDALAARAGRRRPPVKGVYLMPDARNPTGQVIARARREALVAWSRAAEVPLIEDDYGADLLLAPEAEPLPALRALDPEVFHISSFSKRLSPALRVGFIVAPPAVSAPLIRMKHAMDLSTSAILQHGLAEFLDRGLLAPHLARLNAAYRARRDALVTALQRALPRSFAVTPPSRGVVLWLPLPGLDPVSVFEAARARGVLVSPSTLYSIGDSAPGLRLAFSAEPPERLVEGARRLGLAIDDLVQGRFTARRNDAVD